MYPQGTLFSLPNESYSLVMGLRRGGASGFMAGSCYVEKVLQLTHETNDSQQRFDLFRTKNIQKAPLLLVIFVLLKAEHQTSWSSRTDTKCAFLWQRAAILVILVCRNNCFWSGNGDRYEISYNSTSNGYLCHKKDVLLTFIPLQVPQPSWVTRIWIPFLLQP